MGTFGFSHIDEWNNIEYITRAIAKIHRNEDTPPKFLRKPCNEHTNAGSGLPNLN